MRWTRIKAHNMGPFRDIDIDFESLPGTLVAVHGENGAGKSVLLEMLAAALYRKAPSRGSLVGLATARDSSLEVTVVNGHTYKIEHSLDAVSGDGTTLVRGADGKPQYEGTGVSKFDAWAKERIVPSNLLYASAFAPQQRKNRRSFLDINPTDRKGVVLGALGLERFEKQAKLARERATTAEKECAVLRGRLGELPAVDMKALRATEAARVDELARAEQLAHNARLALERAKAAAGDAARRAELAEQRKAALAREQAAVEALELLDKRLDNNRKLLGRKAELEAAQARVAALDVELAQAREALTEASAQERTAREKLTTAETAMLGARRAEQEAKARLERAQRRLVDRPKVLAAQAALEGLRAREFALTADIGAAEVKLAELEALVLAGKDQRIGGLLDAHVKIMDAADADAPFQAWSAYAVEADAALRLRMASAPGEVDAARQRRAALRADLVQVAAEIRTQTALAARVTEMEAAEADRVAAAAEFATANDHLRQVHDAVSVATTAVTGAEQDRLVASATVRRLEGARAPHAAMLVGPDGQPMLPRLEAARARIEELEADRPAAVAALENVRAELAQLPKDDGQVVDIAGAERAVTEAEAVEGLARDMLARARAAIETGEVVLARRADIQAELDAKQADFADWTRLGQDLGRDGVQAMEIDAVLPELNEIANALLRSCHGPRFTVEIRTEAQTKDGKKTIEDLDINVYDAEGWTAKGDADLKSGGEAVIVNEAISLGLTMIMCRRFGLEQPVLVRDESGAALSPTGWRSYLKMLRRAAAELRCSKVLFVTHAPEALELADVKLLVADGRVAVMP
jgi:exonuclease SbcC